MAIYVDGKPYCTCPPEHVDEFGHFYTCEAGPRAARGFMPDTPPPRDDDAPMAPVVALNGQQPVAVEPFATYGVDDLASLPIVEWVVDRLIQRGEGTLLYGERGAGKSLVTLDLLLHIAAGIPWRGRPTRRERVLLVVLENSYAMSERISEWRDRHPGADLSGFRFTTSSIRATDGADLARLHATVEQYKPGVVAVDTWQRFSAGLDEISGRDMQIVIDALDEIRRRHDCTVVMVDHSGKDPRRGTRGHSSKEASFTVVAQVSQSEHGVVRLSTEKVNNGPTSTESWCLVIGDHGPWLQPVVSKEAVQLEREQRIERVVGHVAAHPMIYRSTIEKDLGGKATLVRDALDDAVARGLLIEHKPSARIRQYETPSVVPEQGTLDPDSGRPL